MNYGAEEGVVFFFEEKKKNILHPQMQLHNLYFINFYVTYHFIRFNPNPKFR